MPKVVLVNPSRSTVGFSFLTPRWLFVLAGATPAELVGDPVLVDESLEAFDPSTVGEDDIVGVGIGTVNCRPGYRVVQQAKARGARVIVGGIHASLMPDEPLAHGADAVVTGNGDVIWADVIADALAGRLKARYAGGRVTGDALVKARWSLMPPGKYMFPTVQTVAGCPENCSFCSVWVSDGRKPRQRLTDTVIDEVNELYAMGYRALVLADDNFAPATLGRIAREPSAQKRQELSAVREERLRFFEEYDRRVPKDIFAFSQLTSEIVSDETYLAALYHQVRLRLALVGIESYSEEGLVAANKQWNPKGSEMVRTIQRIQAQGIAVLSSMICGLESDTVRSLGAMREFAVQSGTLMAQFALYNPYPGTVDYYEMVQDQKKRDVPGYRPKHRTSLLLDRFWLTDAGPAEVISHAQLTGADLLRENRRSWDRFYSIGEILRRTRTGIPERWGMIAKATYVMISLLFRRVYAGNGLVADVVHRRKIGRITRAGITVAMFCYRWCAGGGVRVRLRQA
jgi:radical SAM superfamily enzyme YgiQ (UPF0313 family)